MTFTGFDHECMARALRLARRGLYTTDPNPRVGCVIADARQVVADGWHRQAGGPHAEIHALESLGRPAKGMTMYVTLEPCSHQGRTPPCVDTLLEQGLQRVVIAVLDPNEAVNGSSVAKLRENGVRVDVGLLGVQAEELNPGFSMRMREGRPWLRVKIATSVDGRTALQNGDSKWISGPESRQDVQRWRARSSAVLTGIGTVLADDPALDARVGEPCRQPLRVILDSAWRMPPDSRILAGNGQALLVGSVDKEPSPALQSTGAECVQLAGDGSQVDLVALMGLLAEREINEVQVEAGPRLCGALLEAQLVDELLIYQAPVLMGDGAAGPFSFGPLESMSERTHLERLDVKQIGNDLRIRLRPSYRN